jgi:Transglutaminase-like superfamily
LREGGIDAVRVGPPPPLPASAELGVSVSLRLRREACLVRALVRQQWLAAHGSSRDLVIGVRGPSSAFMAHAWLDGDPPCHSEGFAELIRRPVAR